MSPTASRVLDIIADSYDPIVALVGLVAPPFLPLPRKAQTLLRFYVAAALGLAVVYGVQWLDNLYQIWLRFGLDYSTHSAFAASVVVSLCRLRRTWVTALITSLLIYFTLVLFLGYHGAADILTAAALAAVATWLAHWSFRPRLLRDEG